MSAAPALPDLFDLRGHVAIVTGASSGLGARFATTLCAAGATVVAAARRGDRLEALHAAVGDTLVPFEVDLSDDTGCDRLVAYTFDRFGRLDTLVNNAGTATQGSAEDDVMSDFRHTVDVNVNSLFHMCQLAARRMMQQGTGSIVNIASIVGLVASAPVKQAGYCASKGAVISLTRELAVQWARSGVRVNAIAPGWFPTEMTADFFNDERSHQWMRRNCPMGRGGDEHELDGILLFLSSTASSYCTGQTIAVDGGWTAR